MGYSLNKFAGLVVILAAGIALAQTPGRDLHPGSGNTQEERPGFMRGHMDLDRVALALNLTDPQKEQARTIFQHARESALPIRRELKEKREKLFAAAKTTNSEADIQKLAEEQGRLLGKLIAIRTEASAKFYRMLTPEQRVRYDQMHEQFRQKIHSQNPGTESR
jgi:Spy/CpxP family protein refolding chaperone